MGKQGVCFDGNAYQNVISRLSSEGVLKTSEQGYITNEGKLLQSNVNLSGDYSCSSDALISANSPSGVVQGAVWVDGKGIAHSMYKMAELPRLVQALLGVKTEMRGSEKLFFGVASAYYACETGAVKGKEECFAAARNTVTQELTSAGEKVWERARLFVKLTEEQDKGAGGIDKDEARQIYASHESKKTDILMKSAGGKQLMAAYDYLALGYTLLNNLFANESVRDALDERRTDSLCETKWVSNGDKPEVYGRTGSDCDCSEGKSSGILYLECVDISYFGKGVYTSGFPTYCKCPTNNGRS